jgi:hypothetical protein
MGAVEGRRKASKAGCNCATVETWLWFYFGVEISVVLANCYLNHHSFFAIKANMEEARSRVIETNQRLLNAVVSGDYATYSSMCSEDMSCFEAETEGHLVVGLAFHKVFFDLESPEPPSTTVVTMSSPHVRFLDDNFQTAICAYTRFNQKVQSGHCAISKCCETRVWKLNTDTGAYQCVHVHRS